LRIRTALIGILFTHLVVASALANSPLQPWSVGPAPALPSKDLNGRSHTLADYRGKVILVNFWATWCEPCRNEMPTIEALKEKLAGKPFVALAINVDEPEARIRKFVAQTRLGLPVLLDPDKAATRAWSVRVLPASYLIGPDGRVRYRIIGDMDWNTDAAIGVINQLIAGG
jgi:thiol-disulfide isomerase/thioredoxin